MKFKKTDDAGERELRFTDYFGDTLTVSAFKDNEDVIFHTQDGRNVALSYKDTKRLVKALQKELDRA